MIRSVIEELKELPGKKWAILAADYNTGHTAAKAFTEAVEEAGGEVVLEQFAALGSADYASYITKMKDSGADAAFVHVFGADAVQYLNQAAQFSLQDQIKTTIGMNLVDTNTLGGVGDAALGVYGTLQYDVDDGNELNTDFVETFEAKYDTKPAYISANAYISAQALFAGVEEAGSIVPAEALSDIEFDSIVGPVAMRGEDRQLLLPTHIAEVVEQEDGEPGFEIVATEPASVTTPRPNPDCKAEG